MPNAKIERWRGWCEGRLRDELIVMHLHRHVVRELRRVADEHGELPASYFWQYLRDTYTLTQASAIRRQLDDGRDVCSVARLLIEVRENHSLITKRLYVENHSAEERAAAEQRFAEEFAGKDANFLDRSMVEWDRKLLAAMGSWSRNTRTATLRTPSPRSLVGLRRSTNSTSPSTGSASCSTSTAR